MVFSLLSLMSAIALSSNLIQLLRNAMLEKGLENPSASKMNIKLKQTYVFI